MADDQIQINRIGTTRMLVPIVGTAPLLMHRFSEKARKEMLDNMQGRKTPKTAKNPEAEYEACLYRYQDEQTGFPVIAFKAATVGAARFFGSQVTMTGLRQTMFFNGPIGEDGLALSIIDGQHKMREDVVRVGRGSSDLRYRAEFPQWRSELDITFVSSALTEDSVLALVDGGGMGIGIGDWRPERSGTFGTYTIDPDRQVRVVA